MEEDNSMSLRRRKKKLNQSRILSRLSHSHILIPLQQYPPWCRWDTLPFFILYLLFILVDQFQSFILYSSTNSSSRQLPRWVLTNLSFLFPLVLIIHLTVFFVSTWSIHVKKFVGYKSYPVEQSQLKNLPPSCFYCHSKWTHCLVIPPSSIASSSSHPPGHTQRWEGPLNGSLEIVPIHRQIQNQVGVCTVQYEDLIFRYCCSCKEDITFPGKDVIMDGIWNHTPLIGSNSSPFPSQQSLNGEGNVEEKSEPTQSPNTWFHRLHFPLDFHTGFYTQTWAGHATADSLALTLDVYSDNSLSIRLPTLSSLLLEQLVQPFFVFQVFCVFLWSLDEYWYYALFTLVSLVIFESTTAYNRLKNLQRLRETLRPPVPIWVYRKRTWVVIMSDSLVTGDIMSLTSKDQIQVDGKHYFPAKMMVSRSAHEDHHEEEGRFIPADLLLLQGSALVNEATLTGESVPQRKEMIGVMASMNDDQEKLDIEQEHFKRSVLFGGTVLLNHSLDREPVSDQRFTPPPDGGCIFYVLRTGFETLQGSLLRTMVHSTTKSRSDGVNTRDTFIFIFLLLICALGSSILVLDVGWHNPTKNRFKLLLHVVIILTSVVPPELPMELSLAVTHSLTDLIRRCAVYCTEPFRIPYAGMVTTCCFDKTGTLTSDDVQVLGCILPDQMNDCEEISSAGKIIDPISNVLDLPLAVQQIVVGCQGLSLTSQQSSSDFIGDPMEKAALIASGWKMINDKVVTSPVADNAIIIKHRFIFTSQLKRMSVLADIGSGRIHILTKGAPEAIKLLLCGKTIPKEYETVYKQQMRLGRRVLALAYKDLGPINVARSDISKSRHIFENQLIFAGFIIFDSPLKADSTIVIKHLRLAGLETIMITGDSLLTAVEVAQRVGMVEKHNTVYELCEQAKTDTSEPSYGLLPVGRTNGSSANVISLSSIHSLQDACICTSGETLKNLVESQIQMDHHKNILLHPEAIKILQLIVPRITIFARHAPRDKEAVIAALNASGRVTLMVGDGTNDVGALKKAAVGISIISIPEAEKKQRDILNGIQKLRRKDPQLKKSGKDKDNENNQKKKKMQVQKKSTETLRQTLFEVDNEISQVSLGFASVASPFTARTTSIKCVQDILLRGRCTIASMHQIYKILGINCLINAYQLTVLHILGVRSGDTQLTASGIIVAVLFLLVTKGEPLDFFSGSERPSTILSRKIIFSVILQFMCHATSITLVALVSYCFIDPYDSSSATEGVFHANILNTSTFILSLMATVSTFLINYQGHPYMKSLRDNKALLRSLQVSYVIIFALVLDVFPPINDLLQLTPLLTGRVSKTPTDSKNLQLIETSALLITQRFGFKVFLLSALFLDCASAYLVERLIKKYM